MEEMRELLAIMVRLRDPEAGCSWDVQQTFETIAPYTIEEAYEVADAIARGDYHELKGELGDLLLQVVFHARMAEEQGLFNFQAVAQSICDKMVRRHPHVFGDTVFDTDEEQRRHWEQLKHEERSRQSTSPVSAIDGVALALPALCRAEKIQKRAARVGFDWSSIDPVIQKVEEELDELRVALSNHSSQQDRETSIAIEDELGDVFFAATNVARHLQIDPEQALKKATARFEWRFRHVEEAMLQGGLNMTSASEEQMEHYWQMAKAAEQE